METMNYDLWLTEGWHFCLGDVKRFRGKRHSDVYNSCKAGGTVGHTETFLSENEWREVRVPHDWLTELPYDKEVPAASGYKKRGVGWYYTVFPALTAPVKTARLVFEGVLGQTTVYVNGTVAGRNFSGYNEFSCEIADYLRADKENRIVLCVDAREREGWSYEGAGLYRPVRIEFRENIRLEARNSFVRGTETNGKYTVNADIVLSCGDAEAAFDTALRTERLRNHAVKCVLYAPNGTELARTVRAATESLSFAFPVEDAELWSPETPMLYRFVCTLICGEAVIDRFETAVGLRTVTWSSDTGMYLNGERYFVKGICCHQDHGGVGAAVTPELMEYRILRLKSLGINAYRCVHHAMPECFFEICDRLGMLVMAENRNFSVCEDAMDQLCSLVKVARNHPSVFLYSIFNEEPWQTTERGYRMAKRMRAAIRALDSTRAVTAAMNGGSLETINTSDTFDIVGLNYYMAKYGATHERTPHKAILGTENCPTYATRGECATDLSIPVYSTFGDEYAKSFAESMDETMQIALSHPYCAGIFPFSGFDSYGEPQPHEWPSIMSHWGVFDACGFEKGAAHRLAAWYKDALCVRLFPHWNHKDGETVHVVAFTNGDEAELFLDGTSLGVSAVCMRRASWEIPFRAGTLTVTVRRGTETVSDTIRTAGKASALCIEDATPPKNPHYAQRTRILNLSIADENGTVVPDFCEEATLETEGISVLGVANGNPNDPRPLCDSAVTFFHGYAQVIVSSDAGRVTVRCGDLSAEIVTK